ncbi:MAG TPA: methyltransferase domain-containing protein [Thermoanaerobaculia bacterium]|nr:methyltransferase domain-containing protein [Thermoanaerobaculia bacterium]
MCMAVTAERDYVLGTHDDEVARLGLQHRVWRPRALDAWRRAGFTIGQTLLDIGCGPGWAALDIADIVGPEGRVIGLDRSRRFLDVIRSRGIPQIETRELDLDHDDLPALDADGAWARWVFAFVKHPRDLVSRVRRALKPGGVLVLHEYLDYATWRLSPGSAAHEEFVEIVMKSWRAAGGEPDIGLDLPRWLEELGFEIRSMLPIIDVIRPTDFAWQWPRSFIEVGVRRFVDLGDMSEQRASETLQAFADAESAPNTLMVTPAVLEIIAVRR